MKTDAINAIDATMQLNRTLINFANCVVSYLMLINHFASIEHAHIYNCALAIECTLFLRSISHGPITNDSIIFAGKKISVKKYTHSNMAIFL